MPEIKIMWYKSLANVEDSSLSKVDEGIVELEADPDFDETLEQKIVDCLLKRGAIHASAYPAPSGDFIRAVWYSSDETDYRTGETYEYTYHILYKKDQNDLALAVYKGVAK